MAQAMKSWNDINADEQSSACHGEGQKRVETVRISRGGGKGRPLRRVGVAVGEKLKKSKSAQTRLPNDFFALPGCGVRLVSSEELKSRLWAPPTTILAFSMRFRSLVG